MKFSEMTTDQVADALLTITPEVEILVNDDQLKDLWKNRKTTGDLEEAKKLGMVNFMNIAAYLLKAHRKTTWRILGAMNAKTPDAIGKQPIMTTIKQIVEIFTDKEFTGFFGSLMSSGTSAQSDISQE